MRAMTSLPPPAAKPTTTRIARLGYFDASSCASAVFAALAASSMAIRPERNDIGVSSKPGHVNMQHGGLAVVERDNAAVDRSGKLVWLAHAFAMSAEGLCHLREIAPLALASRHQARLELVGLRRDALRVNPLGRGLHRLPAAIVEYERENGDLILLRGRIDAVGRGEMEAAVADHLHDPPLRLREFQAQRHAAGKAEPTAGESHVGLWPGALEVRLQDRPVADRFIEYDVVLREFGSERRKHEGRVERAGDALVAAGVRAALGGGLARPAPAFDACGDALAIGI